MLSIAHHIHINNHIATKDNVPILSLPERQHNAADFYRALGCSYSKFFKMDLLSKWAWIGTEALLRNETGFVYDGLDKNKIAVALYTKSGCLDADKKYLDSMSDIPSPALFVYTLPNIMLGEICIRHGFKGEQMCMILEQFSKKEMMFWVEEKLKQDTLACLCGWVEATENSTDVKLFWITNE